MHVSLSHSALPPSSQTKEALHSLAQAAFHYLDTRLRLASLEGREAVRAGVWMAGAGVIMLFSLGVAYAGLVLVLAWWLADESGAWRALPALAAVVTAHLVLASGCAFWIVHIWRAGRFFHATRKEFMEDKRWLEAHHPSRS